MSIKQQMEALAQKWRDEAVGVGCSQLEAIAYRECADELTALAASLQGEEAVAYPAEFRKALQDAVNSIAVPKMSPLKQDLFKAGTVATINAINAALGSYTAQPPAELARDAARYRWLRDKHNDRACDLAVMYDDGMIEDRHLSENERIDLDAAIDVAMGDTCHD
jgi:hypothetical protein